MKRGGMESGTSGGVAWGVEPGEWRKGSRSVEAWSLGREGCPHMRGRLLPTRGGAAPLAWRGAWSEKAWLLMCLLMCGRLLPT